MFNSGGGGCHGEESSTGVRCHWGEVVIQWELCDIEWSGFGGVYFLPFERDMRGESGEEILLKGLLEG